MKHTISENRRKLIITIDPGEQAELKEEHGEALEAGQFIRIEDILEPLVCNSDLDWIDPSETGDLTDAPMLGIRDDVQGVPQVTERWAFMDYQVLDPVAVLAEHGELVFIN